MGDHLNLERYYWFDNQVRANRFPNAAKLAAQFEISPKTAQRCIDFMRDRLRAPLEYLPKRKGYIYTDNSFILPSFNVSQEELISVLLARNLLATSAGGLISESIHSFGRKLVTTIGGMGLTEEKLGSAFSAVWNGYAPVAARTFKIVIDALLRERYLSCRYVSPATGKETERKIEPHHLQHYMGSWVLIGWCCFRKDWRKFFLSRMADPVLAEETFSPRSKEQWEPLLHASFGIFQGAAAVPVVLHFNAFRAQWIREQVWHPAQELDSLPDGSLRLTIPASDFREVKMMVLQFGADVEVIEPKELRKEVMEEIKSMKKNYWSE